MGGVCLNTVACGILCTEPIGHTLPNPKCLEVQIHEEINKHGIIKKDMLQDSRPCSGITMCRKLTTWSLLVQYHPAKVIYMTAVQCIHFSTFYAFLGALIVDQSGGKSSELAFLMSVHGLLDIAGNILFGFIFDLPVLRKGIYLQPSLYYFCNSLLGLGSMFLPFANTFPYQILVISIWALGASGGCNLRHPLMNKYVGHGSLFADAIGLCLAGIGVGYIFGPIPAGKHTIKMFLLMLVLHRGYQNTIYLQNIHFLASVIFYSTRFSPYQAQVPICVCLMVIP